MYSYFLNDEGFTVQLPPIEAMIIIIDQFLGETILPEIYTVLVCGSVLCLWSFWEFMMWIIRKENKI